MVQNVRFIINNYSSLNDSKAMEVVSFAIGKGKVSYSDIKDIYNSYQIPEYDVQIDCKKNSENSFTFYLNDLSRIYKKMEDFRNAQKEKTN